MGDTEPVTSRGVVRSWHVERMQGVIDGDDVPGGCLVRFAAVAVDGFPALHPGDHVEFEWHRLDRPESGYVYECTRAWPVGQQPVARGRRPFQAGLWRMHADGSAEQVSIASPDQDPPVTTSGGRTTGIVRMWNDEDGWGVIDSPQTPGGCWAHFSHIVAEGFRTVEVGADVTFEWRQVTNQDGYRYCATRVEQHRT